MQHQTLDLSDRVEILAAFNQNYRIHREELLGLDVALFETAYGLMDRGYIPPAIHQFLLDSLRNPDVTNLIDVARQPDRFGSLKAEPLKDRIIYQKQVVLNFLYNYLEIIGFYNQSAPNEVLVLRERLRNELRVGAGSKAKIAWTGTFGILPPKPDGVK